MDGKRIFCTTPTFRKSLLSLPEDIRKKAVEKFQIFKNDPFDPRLGTHRINRLSALHRKTVYGVTITGSIRVIFRMDGNMVLTLDIGSHDVYS